MRKTTIKVQATKCTQHERLPNGLKWDDPNRAVASGGNVGATLINPVAFNTAQDAVMGPGYVGNWSPPVNANLMLPNFLRFSNFTGINIPDNSWITNILVHLKYRDTSTQQVNSTAPEHQFNGGRFLIIPVKSGPTQLCRKLFQDDITVGIKTHTVRIPCIRDQNWGTSTFGPGGKFPDTVSPPRRSVPRVREWLREYNLTWCTDTYEPVVDIVTLNFSEFNSPNFYIDVWYAHTNEHLTNYNGGTLTIYQCDVSLEYIETFTTRIMIFPAKGLSYSTQSNEIPWTNPDSIRMPDSPRVDFDGSAALRNYAFVNVFENPYPITNNNNVNDELIKITTQPLLAKFNPVRDVDITTESISDIVLDVRGNFKGVRWMTGSNEPTVRIRFVLLDGIIPSALHTPTTEPIYKFGIMGREFNIRDDYFTGIGEEWLPWSGEYNMSEGDYTGPNDGETLDWYVRHFPIRPADSGYTVRSQMINTVTYPGARWDPLWLPKALRAGTLYVGLILGINPGTAVYWNTTPRPSGYIRIDSMSLRISYTREGTIIKPPPPSGPPSCIDPPQIEDQYAVYNQRMVLKYESGYVHEDVTLVDTVKFLSCTDPPNISNMYGTFGVGMTIHVTEPSGGGSATTGVTLCLAPAPGNPTMVNQWHIDYIGRPATSIEMAYYVAELNKPYATAVSVKTKFQNDFDVGYLTFASTNYVRYGSNTRTFASVISLYTMCEWNNLVQSNRARADTIGIWSYADAQTKELLAQLDVQKTPEKVNNWYLTHINRPADKDGLNWWMNQLKTKRVEIVEQEFLAEARREELIPYGRVTDIFTYCEWANKTYVPPPIEIPPPPPIQIISPTGPTGPTGPTEPPPPEQLPPINIILPPGLLIRHTP